MIGDYRKFNIDMERTGRGYRLWKRGIDTVTCVMETYKDKRSVYFAVSNLLPSQNILREENKEYHLILLGVEQGSIIHKDFGPFFVNLRGEGSLFKKFSGPELACYTHCLLVVLDKKTEQTETLLSGKLHFLNPVKTGEREKPEGVQAAENRTAENRIEESRSEENQTEKNEVTEEPCEVIEPAIKPLGFTELWGEVFERFYQGNCIPAFCEEEDETGASWCRVSQIRRLPMPLLDCRDFIDRYGHYIIGRKETRFFVGVPGRFLKKEQPRRDDGCFSLWQPIRGGEKYFTVLADMSEALQEEIFGYWIGEIDRETGEILSL